MLLALAFIPSGAAQPAIAAELDGVTMPDLLQVAGTPLRLNGMGLRTYPLFRIHIYVAGLYLQHRDQRRARDPALGRDQAARHRFRA